MLMVMAAIAFLTMFMVVTTVAMFIMIMFVFTVEINWRPRPCHGGFVFEMPFDNFRLPAHAQR